LSGKESREVGGKYRLVRLIGEGGMGSVHEAEHVQIGHRVALKFLVAELARNEGIRIFPLEASDVVVPLEQRPLLQLAAKSVAQKLGPGTQVVAEVNGVAGIWVSLSIDEDRYWLYIERDPTTRNVGTQWIGWASVALLLSVVGAILITRLINRPLAQLSRVAEELGRGRTPALLPASGPAEMVFTRWPQRRPTSMASVRVSDSSAALADDMPPPYPGMARSLAM